MRSALLVTKLWFTRILEIQKARPLLGPAHRRQSVELSQRLAITRAGDAGLVPSSGEAALCEARTSANEAIRVSS
jgi:hypothetical protein